MPPAPTIEDLLPENADLIQIMEALRAEREILRAEHEILRAEHEVLRAEHETLRAEQEELHAEHEELHTQLAQALAVIAELQARLSKDSSNSHKPPSSDGPARRHKRPARRKRSGRKRGGQPGHKGKARALAPPEDVDEDHDVRPHECRGCGGPLSGDDPSPQRVQHLELPPIRPRVIEHRLHACVCPGCGVKTRAELPAGVPTGLLGPRLKALVASLTGVWRMSRRQAQALLKDVLGVDLSLGCMVGAEQDVASALTEPVNELLDSVAGQPVLHIDETGWRESNRRAWLWTVVTPLVTVFLIRPWRSNDVAHELLDENTDGVVVSDRWSAYTWIDIERRQLCWAHLIRDFLFMSERQGEAGRIGTALLTQAKALFKLWGRVRDGTLSQAELAVQTVPIRERVEELLKEGRGCGHAKVPGMCRHMLGLEPAMWTFTQVPGVEPTNNAAERSIRSGVMWRKTSLGTQSVLGSIFAERMLSATATLRQHGQNVLGYLTRLCEAALWRRPAPSLLPESC